MTRIRTKIRYFSGRCCGNYKYFSPTWGCNFVTHSFTERVEDEIHSPPYVVDGPFKAISLEGKPARVLHAPYEKYPGHSSHGAVHDLPMPIQGTFTDVWTFPTDAWLTEVIKRTQDTGPIVDIPLSIAELKDLPRTIRHLGERILTRASVKGVADDALALQFGFLPVLRDAANLVTLQRSLAARMARHRRKYRTRRSRGKLSTPAVYVGWAYWFPSSVGTYTSWGNFGTTFNATQTRDPAPSEQWFSAKIEPQHSLPEVLSEACRNPTGVGEASLSTLWNLIPWSFLIDYFSNLGDVIGLIGNRMPYKITSVCLMCTARLEVTQTPIMNTHPWIISQEWSEGKYAVVEKRRFVYGNPTAGVQFTPLISSGQAAMIAALAGASQRGRGIART